MGKTICLIAPSRKYLFKPNACPPLGLLYIANELEKIGYEVVVWDLALKKLEDLPECDYYGISITTSDFFEAIEVLKFIKQSFPNAKVFAGGPHVNVAPFECLKVGFDGVGVGDGELTMPMLLKGEKFVAAWADEKTMDNFYPDRKIVNLWDYEFYVCGKRATTMLTARGCLWAQLTGGCAFCSRCDNGRIRYHSVKHVEKEVEEISELGFKAIMIYDDEFLTNPKRDEEIIKLFLQYGIYVWRCFLHPVFAWRYKWLVEKAVRYGLGEVLLGIESGSSKILQIIRKGTTPNLNKKVIKFLHELGVKVKAAMIVGLPGESIETLVETWKWLEETEQYISEYDFTLFTPYPGSDIFKNPSKYDIEFDKSSIYTAYKGAGSIHWKPPKVKTSSLTTEQLLKARELLEKRFKYKDYSITLTTFIKEILNT